MKIYILMNIININEYKFNKTIYIYINFILYFFVLFLFNIYINVQLKSKLHHIILLNN